MRKANSVLRTLLYVFLSNPERAFSGVKISSSVPFRIAQNVQTVYYRYLQTFQEPMKGPILYRLPQTVGPEVKALSIG